MRRRTVAHINIDQPGESPPDPSAIGRPCPLLCKSLRYRPSYIEAYRLCLQDERLAPYVSGVLAVWAPQWLLELASIVPRTNSALVAAAVMGSGVDGSTVTLGCYSGLGGGRNRGLHFTPPELLALADFGREARINSLVATVRTAMLIGFGAPYSREGVISDPREYGDGRYYPTAAFVNTLCILAGRGSRELFLQEGQSVYAALAALRREGKQALAQAVQQLLDWYTPRHLATVCRTLDYYEYNYRLAKREANAPRARLGRPPLYRRSVA